MEITYTIGDQVYDKQGNSWFVIAFEYFSSSEAKYFCSNNITETIFYESELFLRADILAEKLEIVNKKLEGL